MAGCAICASKAGRAMLFRPPDYSTAAEKRIKTDRRDAQLLARESRSGNLTSIVMPDERDEAIRDLVRAREDAGVARLRARLQIQAMMLRHGRHYQGKSSWTHAHERHLSTISFEHPAQELAFDEYRLASKDDHERVERITEALRVQCEHWRMNPVVKALMCLRGFDFVAAVAFVAEMGDLSRFAHPRALMAYLGLVPSEFTSGPNRQQGAITKAATNMRDVSSWRPPGIIASKPKSLDVSRSAKRVNRKPSATSPGKPNCASPIAGANSMGRKLTQNKICVAIARELAGFIWDIARQVKAEPLSPSQYTEFLEEHSPGRTASTTPNRERDA